MNLRLHRQNVGQIKKTRDMVLIESAADVGPEVYSLMAAQAKMNLIAKGPQTQSTVNMDNMKGGKRDSYLYNKHKSDYEDEAHHVIQTNENHSSLRQSPIFKFDK